MKFFFDITHAKSSNPIRVNWDNGLSPWCSKPLLEPKLTKITSVLFSHNGNSSGTKHILSQHTPKRSGRSTLRQWISLIVCNQLYNDDSQLIQEAFRRWWEVYIKFSSSDANSCKHRICLLTYAPFNINMSSYQYRKSHCGDETAVRYWKDGIFILNQGPDLFCFVLCLSFETPMQCVSVNSYQ